MSESLPSIPEDVQERLANLSPEKRRLWEQLVHDRSASTRSSIRRRYAVDAPLSFAQERIWFINELEPEASAYHLHLHLPLPANLDVSVWRKSWEIVVERHEIFRTRFVSTEGIPRQWILPRLSLQMAEIDLREFDVEKRWIEARCAAASQAARPFDLTQPPLFRLALFRLPDQYILVMTFHHIIADGWSVDVLMGELDLAYTSLVSRKPILLPPLRVQYADFAFWQREYLTTERLQPLLDYWIRTLDGVPQILLPADRPRPVHPSGEASARSCLLSASLHAEVRRQAQLAGVTPFMWLLTAFCALLHRYTGQEDLVLGTPVANREPSDVEPLIGFFLNTILIRVRLSGGQTFRQVLAAVKEITIGAYSHQQLPFAKLVEAFQPQRDLRRNPLYQVTFQFLTSRVGQARTEVVIPEIGFDQRQIDVDLAFDVFEGAEGLRCRIEYVRDLFDDDSIERFLTHWQRILAEFARDPDTRIDEASLLSDTERDLLLTKWSGVGDFVPFAKDQNLAQFFDHIARRYPHRPAIIGPEKTQSYAHLESQSNQISLEIQRRGVRIHDLIAIQVTDPAETISLILAVWKASAAYLYLDPDLPDGRVEQILADANPVLILSDNDPWWRSSFINRDGVRFPPARANLDSIAAVIYTSGSTGTPKGVVLEHRSLINQAHWLEKCLTLTPEDRVLQKYSFSFDASLAELFTAWSGGVPLVTTRYRGRDLDELIQLIRRERITLIDLFPSMLAALLDHPEFPLCTTLRRIICGGERLTADLLDRCHKLLQVEVLNLYGPTESTITATCHRCQKQATMADPPIGRPILNTEVYVLDSRLQPTPIGLPGELYIGGFGLARGYLHDVDHANARFVAHLFQPHSNKRLYATGDRVRFRSNGVLEYLGRIDRQVKLRGFRIELEEIERHISSHPDVQEAAVAVAMVPDVDPAEADAYFTHLESLTTQEAEFLAEFQKPASPVRNQSMQHVSDQFELYLHLTAPQSFHMLKERQRNWWLRRTLQETAQDLTALRTVAERSIAGSDRPEIAGDLQDSSATYNADELRIQGQQVMQAWELPLMNALAEVAAETHGDVVEVGFGMGLAATLIQQRRVRSHTIVECHPDVLGFLHEWQSDWTASTFHLVPQKWQDWQAPANSYDAVLFDTYPTNEEEYTSDVIDSPTFAASFFPVAHRILRPGGIFTYYSNEIDSLSREHQRLLLRHFRSFSMSVVRDLRVPADCQYWWADSMVVVRAVK